MFKKGDTIYSEAYKYLRRKNLNAVMLQAKGEISDYEEEAMTLPLAVEVRNGVVHFGKWFLLRVPEMSYAGIKTAMVKLRYSNDDQMALILNRERSEEDKAAYEAMQEWRGFAAEVAARAASGRS